MTSSRPPPPHPTPIPSLIPQDLEEKARKLESDLREKEKALDAATQKAARLGVALEGQLDDREAIANKAARARSEADQLRAEMAARSVSSEAEVSFPARSLLTLTPVLPSPPPNC